MFQLRLDAPVDLGAVESKQQIPQEAGIPDRLPSIDCSPSVEDVLHAVLPAKRLVKNGHLFEQYVSSAVPTRPEVASLAPAFDALLKETYARPSGLCPIRKQAFDDLFDELIRQEVLAMPERGLLLARLRQESEMHATAYRYLNESSVIFATRKHLEADEGKDEEEAAVSALKGEKARLERELAVLKRELEDDQERNTEIRSREFKLMAEEVDFLRTQGGYMDTYLKGLQAQ